MIPLFDLALHDADLTAVAEALRDPAGLEMGARTEAFERSFAEHLGCRHAVAVSSCTAALHLAYLAAGVGPDDEVIVPSFTFAATANAARYCGATPVFADIAGPSDLSLDPADVAARITPRTKAVCVVHFGGYAAAVDELRALCDERGLALIEDVAHAPSAQTEPDGPRLGTVGLAGCFSFFSNKVLSVGEGGLVATDDDDVAAFCRRMRTPEHGLPYAFDEPRAALLLSRLARLPGDVARRRALTARYRTLLAGVDRVVLPYSQASVATSSCYVMPVLMDREGLQGPVRRHMKQAGVQTSLLYPSIHRFTDYEATYGRRSLPRSEHASACEVTLPLFADMDEATQDRVVAALEEAVAACA